MQSIGRLRIGKMGEDVSDGRLAVGDLIRKFAELGSGEKPLFEVRNVINQRLANASGPNSYPILRMNSVARGTSLWLLAGVHGEEPAGPNAIAQQIAIIEELAKCEIPVVMYPLLNPAGYAHDWRYYNARRGKGTTIVDPDHVLPTKKRGLQTFANAPVSPYADVLVKDMLALCHSYPPRMVFDLHEDEDLGPADKPDKNPYIYVNGHESSHSSIPHRVVEILKAEGAEFANDGMTRFGEKIEGGIVRGYEDRSVDDLLTRGEIIHTDESGRRRREKGPNAGLCVVVETRIDAIPLAQRVHCHASIIKNLKDFFQSE